MSSRSTTSLPSRAVAVCDSATGVADRRDVVDERVRGVDAELRLARARRSAAAEPGELLAGEVLAALLDRGRLPVTLDALQDVRRVAALEGLDDAVVHLPRVGRHRVEEPPVVRDDHHAALVRRPPAVDVVGEPLDALDVEVVRRLVEEQHVPVTDEQLRERDPAALPTGQVVDDGVPGDVRHETADDVADLRVAGHSCSSSSPTTMLRRWSRPRAGRRAGRGTRRSARGGRCVTRPASGSRRWASSASRVDLPSPFRPTTPMRSPSSRPRVTLSKTTRVGNSRCTFSAPRR